MAEPPRIVAEVGCNHRGDMSIARDLVVAAAQFCHADVVKFQKRCPQELLTTDEFDAPHPNPMHAYGETYGAHREFLEFDVDQHRQIQDWCVELGIEYSSSVWDTTSAREITSLDPAFIKIPSACNLHWEMLDYLCLNYHGEIHLSFGMTTHEEEDEIVQFFESRGRVGDLVVYSCTSGYPVAFEDICLLEITRLKKKLEGRVKAIGFSGHHLGIAADVAAMALEAEWIERHFTLDRTWKGTDHAASLEPDGMRRLTRDLRNVRRALRGKDQEVLEVECMQRDKLKFTKREHRGDRG